MSKPTPGPFTYFVGNSNGRGLIRIETAHDAPIAGIHIASMPRGSQSKANAAFLVHTANCHAELLATLKFVNEHCQLYGAADAAREKIDAAIARAEGGQS